MGGGGGVAGALLSGSELGFRWARPITCVLSRNAEWTDAVPPAGVIILRLDVYVVDPFLLRYRRPFVFLLVFVVFSVIFLVWR